MEFSVNINLTASPDFLGVISRLTDAMMGVNTQRPVSEKAPKALPEEKVLEVKEIVTASKVEAVVTSPEIVVENEIAEVSTTGIYSEAELMDMELNALINILKGYDVDPSKIDGKNTNRKLRLLILEQQANVGEQAPEVIEEVKKVVENTGTFTPTVEQARALMIQKVQGGKREEVKQILANYGFENMTKAGESEHLSDIYNEFVKL